jgi:hypothetical protein
MSMFSTKNGLYERARQRFKIQDGIKLFSYPFYKQRRMDVQVCMPRMVRPHTREQQHHLQAEKALQETAMAPTWCLSMVLAGQGDDISRCHDAQHDAAADHAYMKVQLRIPWQAVQPSCGFTGVTLALNIRHQQQQL